MTKQELENKFLLKVNRLSNRAKFVLQRLKLDQFETFFHFFIEEKNMIDFHQLRNCGYQTGKELYNLINSIAGSAPQYKKENEVVISKHAELLFDEKFHELSTRTRNILSQIGANYIFGFKQTILIHNTLFSSGKLRNCGDKTYREILEFKQKVLEILAQHEQTDSLESISEQKPNCFFDKNSNESVTFSKRAELKFDKQFDELSNRTKNVLSALGADYIFGFNEKILADIKFNFKKPRNCGEKTYNEITEFKSKVLAIIEQDQNEEKSNSLFKDIEIYLFEGNVLRGVELDIVLHYYNFIQKNKSKSLQEIAESVDLTQERVRQLSKIVLDNIKNIILKLFRKGNYDLQNYFQNQYFVVTQNFTDFINKSDKTNFSPTFIIHVLKWVAPTNYDFIDVKEKSRSYSGVFIRNSIQFDFQKCFEFLSQYVDVRRKEDVKVKVDDLIKFFARIKKENLFSKPNELDLIDRMQILEVLKIFTEYISNEEDEIDITPNLIVFKRNTKKLKYEFIVEILSECKKPMHFTELYEECVKRGIKIKSALSIHGMIQHYPDIFGLKGQGIYGLIEWGGYFGKIGDVAEKLLKEKNKPMYRIELIEILSRELYISQDSINTVLFNYEPEKRFVKMNNSTIGLKERIS